MDSIDIFACLSETEKQQAKLRGIISAAIENKRFSMNMTQTEFAAMLGITQGMVSKLESAEYNITVEKMVELFSTLDIDYSIYVNGIVCSANRCAEYKGMKYNLTNEYRSRNGSPVMPTSQASISA